MPGQGGKTVPETQASSISIQGREHGGAGLRAEALCSPGKTGPGAAPRKHGQAPGATGHGQGAGCEQCAACARWSHSAIKRLLGEWPREEVQGSPASTACQACQAVTPGPEAGACRRTPAVQASYPTQGWPGTGYPRGRSGVVFATPDPPFPPS